MYSFILSTFYFPLHFEIAVKSKYQKQAIIILNSKLFHILIEQNVEKIM